MNTHTQIRTLLLLILISTSGFLFAGTGDGNKEKLKPTCEPAVSTQEIGDKISALFENQDLAGFVTQGDEVELTFSLDGQGRIIILDVDGYNNDLNRIAKKTLRNQFINVDKSLTEKIYRLPIEVNVQL